MFKKLIANIKRKKLLSMVVFVILVVVGYFAYKYTYIYTERRKYNTATIAIQKVASDLRAQGIETEFSRGCGRNIEVYGTGSINCSIGLAYNGDKINIKSPFAVNNFLKSLDSHGFKITRKSITIDQNDVSTGFSTYSFKDKNFKCMLKYDDTKPADTKYTVTFNCTNPTRYAIF